MAPEIRGVTELRLLPWIQGAVRNYALSIQYSRGKTLAPFGFCNHIPTARARPSKSFTLFALIRFILVFLFCATVVAQKSQIPHHM
jgi:hypothetical protein